MSIPIRTVGFFFLWSDNTMRAIIGVHVTTQCELSKIDISVYVFLCLFRLWCKQFVCVLRIRVLTPPPTPPHPTSHRIVLDLPLLIDPCDYFDFGFTTSSMQSMLRSEGKKLACHLSRHLDLVTQKLKIVGG